MKKKVRLNEASKSLLMTICVFAIVIGGTMIYLNQIKKATNGEIQIVCDCEMDK